MIKLSYLIFVFTIIIIKGQVGNNTQIPEANLDVIGKPDDINHYYGIIPPRIVGKQLSVKTYSSTKNGAVVFVTFPPTNLSGQVTNVTEPGLYYFDGILWQVFSKEKQPTEYRILLTFYHNSTVGLTATSN